MMSPEPIARAQSRLRFVAGAVAVLGVGVLVAAEPATLHAQGLVEGVQKGAREGNKAAGPIGGVLGGAIGGVVGAVGGVVGAVTGGGNQNQKGAPAQSPAKQDAAKQDAAKDAPKSDASKSDASKSKTAKATAKGAKQPAVLTQPAAPQLSAEQIVASSDANIERIKKELNLTPEQEKHWSAFNSAMHYLGHNGADRLKLRVARAQRDPPDDIIEQMRNEAQFLNDRAVDQRNVADAADPLFASLDDKQKQYFINEMVRLSHERGLD
ncbi:Spy/CpxP family protein refolding chaperone [Bradyrhizobium sp.]|uniref:Spy/CpxP family protein refolding chaperone n=1 Tax=Bradyrhizobium sp. TaxID=376 RepID=UPI004037BB21